MAHYTNDLGEASYDDHEFGARWWLDRARDTVHKRAYQTIADAARRAKPDARVVIDYACGPGLLLSDLSRRLPKAKLIGLDEAHAMLDDARIVLGARLGIERALGIDLEQTALPDFDLDLPKADLVTFSFPDFRDDLDGRVVRALKKAFPKDWERTRKAAKKLKQAAKADEECDAKDDWITDVDRLFFERCGSRNIRGLLRKGGMLVRVDYAPGDREDWIDPFLDRFDWACGSLEPGTCSDAGKRSHRLFEVVSTSYHRSKVIRDVHAQTGEDDHESGGYMISVMRRL